MATFTVPTTGVYENSRTGGRFKHIAGSVIDLALAVDLGMEGASLPAAGPPFNDAQVDYIEEQLSGESDVGHTHALSALTGTGIVDPQEGDALLYVGDSLVNMPGFLPVVAGTPSTGTASDDSLTLSHTVPPRHARRVVVATVVTGAPSPSGVDYGTGESPPAMVKADGIYNAFAEIHLYVRSGDRSGTVDLVNHYSGESVVGAIGVSLANALQDDSGTTPHFFGLDGSLSSSQVGAGTVFASPSAVESVPGDLVLLAIATSKTTAPTLPAGFAVVDSVALASGAGLLLIAAKRAVAESTSVTFACRSDESLVALSASFAPGL